METLYMGEEQIVVKIGEKEKTYPAGVSFLSIAQEYQDQYEDDIVLAPVSYTHLTLPTKA